MDDNDCVKRETAALFAPQMSDHLASQEDIGGKGHLEVLIPPPLPHSWDESKPAWGCSAPRPGDSEHLQGWKFPSLSMG